MSVTFVEALKNLMNSSRGQQIKKIKLVNGEILEGTISKVNQDMIEMSMPDKGAGRAVYTIPVSSVLFISDCELR
jgi:hypothetical protein